MWLDLGTDQTGPFLPPEPAIFWPQLFWTLIQTLAIALFCFCPTLAFEGRTFLSRTENSFSTITVTPITTDILDTTKRKSIASSLRGEDKSWP